MTFLTPYKPGIKSGVFCRYAALFITLGSSFCASYDKKDGYQKTVGDYAAAIKKEPRNHELYFRRGELYLAQYYESHEVFTLALSDFDKAVELAGASPPLEYFTRRAFAYAARGLDNPIWTKEWGRYLRVKDVLKTEDLKNAVADYDKVIPFTDNPLRLLNYYQQRGQLHYYLKQYGAAANDFVVVERLQQSQDMGTIEESFQVWQALDYTYEELLKETAGKNAADLQKWQSLKSESSAKLSFWRNASIKDYEERQARKRERQEKERREHAEQCMAKAKAAHARRTKCSHCGGKGYVINYNAGTGGHWEKRTNLAGRSEDHWVKGKDSSASSGSCPVCFGKGYTLPHIEGCDPRDLE